MFRGRAVLYILGVSLSAALAAEAQRPPSLGSAASFAVLGGTSVTSGDYSRVSGNLGVSPGSAVSGFPPASISLGQVFRDDATARAAQQDLADAYRDLADRPCGRRLTSLGGATLAPGVYCFESGAELAGVLTLDGNLDGVWIFQVPGNLATVPESLIVTMNGAHRGNVHWQVGGSATLGTGTTFVGNIIARGNITLAGGASISGRALSLGGAVTLSTNDVSLCCDAIRMTPALPGGALGTEYEETIAAEGGATPYKFTLVSGSLPPGLTLSGEGVVSGVPEAAGSFAFVVMVTDRLDCSRIRPYTVGICSALSVSPPEDTTLTACLLATREFKVTGGTPPYVFRSDGPLPPGMMLPETPSEDGVLSGTPKTAGVYSFPVTATDAAGCTATRIVTITVVCPPLRLVPETLPNRVVGADASDTFSVAGGCGPFEFSSTPLPAKLGLSRLRGVLSGIAETPGIFVFDVTAVDAVAKCSVTATYTLAVCPLTIAPEVLGDATTGVVYTQLLTVGGGSGSYRFRVSAGSLPPEVEIDPRTGTISGPPSLRGDFPFTVEVVDTVTGCTGSRDYVLHVRCPALTISPSAFPPATVDSMYDHPLSVAGAVPPVMFTVTEGSFPPGLGPDLSGTPTLAGSFSFTIRATDAAGCEAELAVCTFDVHGSGCPEGTVITLSPDSLASAAVGEPYSETVTASGGTGPYTFFEVTPGSLPPGLSLDSMTGDITGMATSGGIFEATIAATDANGCTGSRCFTLVAATTIPALSWPGLAALFTLLAAIAAMKVGRSGA